MNGEGNYLLQLVWTERALKKKTITKRTHQQQIKWKYPVFVKTKSLAWSLKLWFPGFAEMTS